MQVSRKRREIVGGVPLAVQLLAAPLTRWLRPRGLEVEADEV
jgi:hypothetical protein